MFWWRGYWHGLLPPPGGRAGEGGEPNDQVKAIAQRRQGRIRRPGRELALQDYQFQKGSIMKANVGGADKILRIVAETPRRSELPQKIPCYIYRHAGELIAS